MGGLASDSGCLGTIHYVELVAPVDAVMAAKILSRLKLCRTNTAAMSIHWDSFFLDKNSRLELHSRSYYQAYIEVVPLRSGQAGTCWAGYRRSGGHPNALFSQAR